jgi:transcriptional regulator with XRE-family HTH domain
MSVEQIIDDVRRRMLAAGLKMKRLSLEAGLGETYVRDLLTGRSKNPKTEELQKVMDVLNRYEDNPPTAKKGRS